LGNGNLNQYLPIHTFGRMISQDMQVPNHIDI